MMTMTKQMERQIASGVDPANQSSSSCYAFAMRRVLALRAETRRTSEPSRMSPQRGRCMMMSSNTRPSASEQRSERRVLFRTSTPAVPVL